MLPPNAHLERANILWIEFNLRARKIDCHIQGLGDYSDAHFGSPVILLEGSKWNVVAADVLLKVYKTALDE